MLPTIYIPHAISSLILCALTSRLEVSYDSSQISIKESKLKADIYSKCLKVRYLFDLTRHQQGTVCTVPLSAP